MKLDFLNTCIIITFSIFGEILLLAQGHSLKLILELNKSAYLKSEPIYANVYLTNESAKEIHTKLFSQDDGNLGFVIRDANGNSFLDRQRRWFTGDSSMPLTISARDTEKLLFNLLPAYGLGDRRFSLYHTKVLLPIGEYTIQAKFQTGYDTIYSNIFHFIVEEPRGKELDAIKELDTATDLELDKKFNEAEELYGSFLKRYPKSVYLSAAIVQAWQHFEWHKKDYRKAYDLALRLVDLFPSGDAAVSGISYALTHNHLIKKSRKDRENLLNYIEKKYSNTKVGKWCRRVLKKNKFE